MRPETCERILKALETSFNRMGASFAEGLKILGDLHKNAAVKFYKRHRNRRTFKAFLLRAPEPTPKEMNAFIATCELMPWMLRAAVDEHFPPDPGGKSFSLSEAE